ncbi:MAG: pirin family protein, partial [Salinibacter sp.]
MTDSSPQTTESAPRIRRSDERGVQDLGWSVNRMTFSFADYYDPDWMHLHRIRLRDSGMDVRKCGRVEVKHLHTSILPDVQTRTEHAEFVLDPLRVLIESRIDPNEGFSEHPHRHAEIVSYVTECTFNRSIWGQKGSRSGDRSDCCIDRLYAIDHAGFGEIPRLRCAALGMTLPKIDCLILHEGTLRHRDSNGHEADIERGEMQLISAGRRGMVHQETNPRTEPEAHYQMWFIPDRDDTSFAYHERKPSVEARRGQFHTYVSPDGRGDTMPVHTDAFVDAGLFAPDDRPSHALPPGRGAWVQAVDGIVSVGGVTLRTGDGAGVTNPTALRFSF